MTNEPAPFADFHTLTAELRSVRAELASLRAENEGLRQILENASGRTGYWTGYWLSMPTAAFVGPCPPDSE